jgi:DedD protein
MKEKLDVSLDNRQVVSLLISGLVVLGAVFVLGVVVGKKLSTNSPAQPAADVLSALDRAADAATPEPRLTFQEELTKKAAEPLPAPVPSELPAEPLEEEPPAPVKMPERLVVKVDPVIPEPKPAPVPAPRAEAPVSPDAAVPTRTAHSNKESLKDAVDSLRKAAPEAAANGQFTLQLSASQSRSEAERFMSKLRDKGYAPFMIEATVPGRGTWYRVRMGSFATKEAAQRYLHDFRRETQLDGFVAGGPT